MSTIWKVLTRKKVVDGVSVEETRLSRVLNTLDLTSLGVGSTLGVGVYVLAGHVAKDTAGPAVVLSFLIAAVASVFAGLCYAEFGARVPKAGSAYIYSYVCVGEFIAFIIGWNLILEYVIGSASVARGLSLYLDTLINDTMQNAFIEIAPISFPYLSTYFDFFAFGISVLLAVVLAMGIKESSVMNNIFTTINIFVVLFVIIAGSTKADLSNWAVDPAKIVNGTHIGKGGFFPFGIEGVIKGAATCFYGFVGFDCIATTGEEVRNPKRAIPISIMLSLFVIFLAYFGTSTVVTLMVPYYRQNPDAPIPYAFEAVDWYTAKWIVSIGGIFGLCASLFGAMFPLPRIIYAMANDGLVFRFLGNVHPRFKTPFVGTLLAGVLTGLMAALFELKQLVNMMSIGTLQAYTIVAASVLLLRYTEDKECTTVNDSNLVSDETNYEDSRGIVGKFFNCGRNSQPNSCSEKVAAVDLSIYGAMCVLIGLCAIYLKEPISNGEVWAIVFTSMAVLVAVFVIMSLVTQPTSKKELSFKVPAVPLIPALSILTNIYLMLMLDSHTWMRFAVWMIIGLPIYYFLHKPYTEAQNRNNTTPEIKKNDRINGNLHYFVNRGYEDTERPLDGSSTNTNANMINEINQELQKLDEMLNRVDGCNCVNCDLSALCVDPAACESTCENTKSTDSENGYRSVNSTGSLQKTEKVIDFELHKEGTEFSTKVYVTENLVREKNVTINKLPNDVLVEQKVEPENVLKSKFDGKYSQEQTIENQSDTVMVGTIPNSNCEGDSETVLLENKENSFYFACRNKTSSKGTVNSIKDNGLTVYNDSNDRSEHQYDNKDDEIEDELTSVEQIEIGSSGTETERNPPEECKSNNVSLQHQTIERSEGIEDLTKCDVFSITPFDDKIDGLSLTVNIKQTGIDFSQNDKCETDGTRENNTQVQNAIQAVLARDPCKVESISVKDEFSENVYEPDEDNLKVGSPKYKVFLENLNKKLNKLTVFPAAYALHTNVKNVEKHPKDTEMKQSEYKSENILEESINTAVAKEKLLAFINAGHISPGTYKKDPDFSDKPAQNVANDSEISAILNNGSNNTEIDLTTQSEENYVKPASKYHDDEYALHKTRMQSVFRSINLKRKDSTDTSHPKESKRQVSTVAYINEDKITHKQAMSEIFKTIKLKRKDSTKQD